MTNLNEHEQIVAKLIIDTLNLDNIKVDDIDPEAPLFSEGLGLDSIDALELALAISKQYGIQLRSGDTQNTRIFSSLRAISDHIYKNRIV